MAEFVLIHGAGSDSWYWHRLVPELAARGHGVVAPDLPCDDDSAGLAEYAEIVVAAARGRAGVVLVAQSLGGFTAPLVCDRLPVDLLVMVDAMIPFPGEPPGEWWDATGFDGRPLETEADFLEVFFHDVPGDVASEGMRHGRPQSGTPFEKPWPLDEWPSVPTRFLVSRDDRFFTPDFQRRVLRDRLGAAPDEIEGGHLIALSRPEDLAERLDSYAAAPGAASVPRFRR